MGCIGIPPMNKGKNLKATCFSSFLSLSAVRDFAVIFTSSQYSDFRLEPFFFFNSTMPFLFFFLIGILLFLGILT